MERCIRIFKAGVKSEATWKSYFDSLTLFKNWGKYATYSDILKRDPKELQMHLEDYILELADLYVIDEFGNEKLIFCASTGVWEED